MSKAFQPMTAPAVPTPSTPTQMSPRVGSPPGNNRSDTDAPRGMREGSKREEAFDRGVTQKVTHTDQAHHIKKMRGGA